MLPVGVDEGSGDFLPPAVLGRGFFSCLFRVILHSSPSIMVLYPSRGYKPPSLSRVISCSVSFRDCFILTILLFSLASLCEAGIKNPETRGSWWSGLREQPRPPQVLKYTSFFPYTATKKIYIPRKFRNSTLPLVRCRIFSFLTHIYK